MGKFLPAIRRSVQSKSLERYVKGYDPETKALLTNYFSGIMTLSGRGSVTREWPVERAVQEGFDRVMWVFKSVMTIGADQARLPYKIREGDEGDPLSDHPLYYVLNEQANPLEDAQVFRKRLSAQVLLSKRGAFVEVTRSMGGRITRVDLLPPGRTRPVPGTGSDLISHWELVNVNGTKRAIDIDKVRWFREPHPLDPYSGVTPLESAGMSVELDYFSRLYNVQFMRNDGRPGGIVAVDAPSGSGEGGDMDEADMARLESRFGRGPYEAGKVTVVNGKVSFADLAARPRDMQYAQTSENAKTEILSAFGVPESVLGFAANRTYANAEQELYNYWTRTMLAHNEIILAGWEKDVPDGHTGYFDTSSVEVLERHQQAKRQEARDEVAAGLRSIHSYATLAGYADEIESTPMTRALYIPQGRTPLPSRKDDEAALGLSQPDPNSAPADAAPAEPAASAPAASGNEFESQTGAAFEPGGGAPTPSGGQTPPRSLTPAVPPRAPDSRMADRPNLSVVGGAKAKIRVERKEQPRQITDSEPDPEAVDALESSVAAALSALAPRWAERTVARLESPKARKGTRHWNPDHPADPRLGTKALDAFRAVDEQRWIEEAVAHVEGLIIDAAVKEAVRISADLGSPLAQDAARGIVANTTEQVLGLVRESTRGLAEGLVSELERLDAAETSMPEMAQAVREYGHRISTWARTVAVQVASGTINGAREAAAADLEGADLGIVRTWVSRRDNKVRVTHAAADAEKQTRAIGAPFLIGNALLRYPGDPLGPAGETRNCRCYLRHRATATGQFAPNPRAVQV